MTTFKKLSTAIATGAVLLSSVAPAFATTVEVSGNGAYSESGAAVSTTSTTAVTQSNTANITNNVDSNASTGGNDASFNTGGNTTVNTGDATNNVEVSNAVNVNDATVTPCGGCAGQEVDVTISGNGAFSHNGADVDNTSTTALTQDNVANITNNVDADAKTGYNDAGFNTGGDTVIRTGDASVGIVVDNMANANIARIGGGAGGAGGSSITISGNGAFSTNGVDLDNVSVIALEQDNEANITNNIDADAKTGGNDADFNTGGDVHIVTGKASTDVEVSNLVNFNAADVDCGCVLDDLELKIAGNGAFSFNGIDADDTHVLAAGQVNDAYLTNNVEDDAKTGYNDAGFNVGEVDSDPSVRTGDASSTTEVSNSGNVNSFNQGDSLDLPWDLDLHFDLLGLWGGFWHMVA